VSLTQVRLEPKITTEPIPTLFTFAFLLLSLFPYPPALCQVIIGKFLLKTKDDTISGLGFQRIWLYTPKKTNGLNIRLLLDGMSYVIDLVVVRRLNMPRQEFPLSKKA